MNLIEAANAARSEGVFININFGDKHEGGHFSATNPLASLRDDEMQVRQMSAAQESDAEEKSVDLPFESIDEANQRIADLEEELRRNSESLDHFRSLSIGASQRALTDEGAVVERTSERRVSALL